jgi:hypothetical protein
MSSTSSSYASVIGRLVKNKQPLPPPTPPSSPNLESQIEQSETIQVIQNKVVVVVADNNVEEDEEDKEDDGEQDYRVTVSSWADDCCSKDEAQEEEPKEEHTEEPEDEEVHVDEYYEPQQQQNVLFTTSMIPVNSFTCIATTSNSMIKLDDLQRVFGLHVDAFMKVLGEQDLQHVFYLNKQNPSDQKFTGLYASHSLVFTRLIPHLISVQQKDEFSTLLSFLAIQATPSATTGLCIVSGVFGHDINKAREQQFISTNIFQTLTMSVTALFAASGTLTTRWTMNTFIARKLTGGHDVDLEDFVGNITTPCAYVHSVLDRLITTLHGQQPHLCFVVEFARDCIYHTREHVQHRIPTALLSMIDTISPLLEDRITARFGLSRRRRQC